MAVLESKLTAVGYGFFIPFFFVVSGVKFDLERAHRRPGQPAQAAAVPGPVPGRARRARRCCSTGACSTARPPRARLLLAPPSCRSSSRSRRSRWRAATCAPPPPPRSSARRSCPRRSSPGRPAAAREPRPGTRGLIARARRDGDDECEKHHQAQGRAQARCLGQPADHDRARDGSHVAERRDAAHQAAGGGARSRSPAALNAHRHHGAESEAEQREARDPGGGARARRARCRARPRRAATRRAPARRCRAGRAAGRRRSARPPSPPRRRAEGARPRAPPRRPAPASGRPRSSRRPAPSPQNEQNAITPSSTQRGRPAHRHRAAPRARPAGAGRAGGSRTARARRRPSTAAHQREVLERILDARRRGEGGDPGADPEAHAPEAMQARQDRPSRARAPPRCPARSSPRRARRWQRRTRAVRGTAWTALPASPGSSSVAASIGKPATASPGGCSKRGSTGAPAARGPASRPDRQPTSAVPSSPSDSSSDSVAGRRGRPGARGGPRVDQERGRDAGVSAPHLTILSSGGFDPRGMNLIAAALVATGAVSGFSDPRTIDNPYLPLSKFTLRVPRPSGRRHPRAQRREAPEALAGVHCERPARRGGRDQDRAFEDGRLVEETLDYFAQADDGTVHYFGEHVDNVAAAAWWTTTALAVRPRHRRARGGHARQSELGTSGASRTCRASRPIRPRGGGRHARQGGREALHRRIRCRSSSQPEGDVEYKLYAPGVGLITEYPPDGRAVLRGCR